MNKKTTMSGSHVLNGNLNGKHYDTMVCKLMAIFFFSSILSTEYDVTAVSADDLNLSKHEITSLTGKYGVK
jgi:hypothetical protein